MRQTANKTTEKVSRVILFDRKNYSREYVKVNGRPAELYTLKKEAESGEPQFLLFIDGHFQKLSKKVEAPQIEQEIQAEPSRPEIGHSGTSMKTKIEWQEWPFNFMATEAKICKENQRREKMNESNLKTKKQNG